METATETPIEIIVRAPKGHEHYSRFTCPAMATLPEKAYVADEAGLFHFTPAERVHAEIINGLCRDEDKATETLAQRAQLLSQKENSMGRLENVIRDAVGGRAETAAAIASAVNALLPELKKQIREELLAEMTAPNADKGGKK